MISRDYTDTPFHEHDCKKCDFQFGIEIIKNPDSLTDREVHKVDVYRQCSGVALQDKDKYLLRWSSDGPDYHSGLDIKSLCAGYFSHMHGV